MNTRDHLRALSSNTHPPFRPRLPELQRMNGLQVETPGNIDWDAVPIIVQMLLQMSGAEVMEAITTDRVGDMKLGRWLRKKGVTEADISATYKSNTVGAVLTFTTRYKDILRAATSAHYNSCAGSNGSY